MEAGDGLVLVDGPYGLNKYTGDEIRTPVSYELYKSVFASAYRRHRAHLIIFGIFDSLSWLREANIIPPAYIYRSCVIWHKPDWVGGSVKNIRTFSPRHEMFLHYSLENATFHMDAIRQPYGERARKGVAKKTGRKRGWTPNPLGARCGDVLTFTSDRLSTKMQGRTLPNQHPCVKPTELLRLLVLATTSSKENVDEPFYGSDNLEQVCKRENRIYRSWLNAVLY